MHYSWETLRKLEEDHGDSFYLLDIEAFQSNYREFLSAFQRIYPNTNIGYSYKTNYTPRLCQRVLAMGGYAEVVSSMEYELAMRIGVPLDRIIFNGPYKSPSDLERALLGGSIVNIDSLHEVDSVEKIATQAPDRMMTVGIRCNFDIGTENVSRFGFDVDGEDFRAAFERLSRLENCAVGGFHCHFSTGNRSIESYALRARRMLELYTEYFFNSRPRFINLGGGYFSKMSLALQQQFAFPVPTYRDYAEAIASQIIDAFPDAGPELIVEPGSALTADVMQFVAKIIDIKTVRSRVIALASGSIHNIKPTMHAKNMPLHMLSEGNPAPRTTHEMIDIVGYTCMEHDSLFKGYSGTIAAGDYALFSNIGAYTVVMKPPFIRPSPPMLAYQATTGEVELIKRREETSDVFATYCF